MTGVDFISSAHVPDGCVVVMRESVVIWLGAPDAVPDLRDGDQVHVSPAHYARIKAATNRI